MPKILIVDDDRTTTKLLQTLLEMDGFDVVIASRGEKAFDIAREANPDAMLIDYHLSDMEGVELVTRFRADEVFAKTPIVMASGLDVETEALKAGANKFLVKPLEPGSLADMFNGLLG